MQIGDRSNSVNIGDRTSSVNVGDRTNTVNIDNSRNVDVDVNAKVNNQNIRGNTDYAYRRGGRYDAYLHGYADGARHSYYHNRYRRWDDYWTWRTATATITLGTVLATQPRYYSTVYYDNTVYYYSDGVYYVRDGNTYVVVAAPTGAVVQTPPPTYEVVYYDETNYIYANGTYYEETDEPADNLTEGQSTTEEEAAAEAEENADPDQLANAVEEPDPFEGEDPPEGVEEGEQEDPNPEANYKVVSAPVGAIVSMLPEDAEEIPVGEDTYYRYVDTWYKPFYSGEDIVYMVVEKPAEAA